MEDDQTTCRPVPAPRRLYPELRKSEYENVKVELMNKNLNINSENIQNNANNSDKVPNNKVFLLYPTLPDVDSDNRNVNATATQKSILTETNDLYGPNANENVPIYTTPRPAPRPRKPQNTDVQNYENTIITPAAQVTQPETPLPITQNTAVALTGAVSRDVGGPSGKVLRKAPELPPKTYLNFERENERRRSNHSISSEFSTTSSIHNASLATNETKDTNFKRDRLNKSYASYKSSSSSLAESIESSENSKYKSPSPGYVEENKNTDNNEINNDNDNCNNHVVDDDEVSQNDSINNNDDDNDDVDGQNHITTSTSDK